MSPSDNFLTSLFQGSSFGAGVKVTISDLPLSGQSCQTGVLGGIIAGTQEAIALIYTNHLDFVSNDEFQAARQQTQ
jgi:hypothetical protein